MEVQMKLCEYCTAEHIGDYGSGRFCSEKCARGFASKEKRLEMNEKISKKLKNRVILYLQKYNKTIKNFKKTLCFSKIRLIIPLVQVG